MRQPKVDRLSIEQHDELDGYFRQANISAKNIARLETLSRTAEPEIAADADLIARLARVQPRKRHRLRFLIEERRDLLQELVAAGVISTTYGDQDSQRHSDSQKERRRDARDLLEVHTDPAGQEVGTSAETFLE